MPDQINQTTANQISVDHSKTDAKEFFCQNWSNARGVIQALHDLLKNPIAKAAVGIVLTAGDTLQGVICQNQVSN